MAKKEKMPKFSGFRMTKDGLGPPVYEVTMTIAPDQYGVSHDATNREMVNGVFNHINSEMLALRARAEAAEARAAQAEADARLMAGLAFASFVARTSFSAEIVDASLLDALEVAGDHAATVSDADMIAAVRRILAAGGAA